MLKNFLILLWRLWFYLWVLLLIVIGLPILLITTSSESLYPVFFRFARFWAKTILFVMGFWKQVEYQQKIEQGKSYMFCANHTSMIDVMLMLSVVKNPFVFVGKKELVKIPIFGFFYKKTCILVDRSDPKSRKAVFQEAQRRLNDGLSICIFPEGGVPDDEDVILDEFKSGAFILAIEHEIPIVPMVFYDCKKRFSYTFFSGSPGKLRVKVLPFVKTKFFDLEKRKELSNQVRTQIKGELEAKVQNK